MAELTGKTRGGADWIPQFITAIDQAACIGCGRCYKACARAVLDLVEYALTEDDEDCDSQTMVMAIKDVNDCIGCGACTRVCPKNCYSHAPLAV